jgi:hypothetical protein
MIAAVVRTQLRPRPPIFRALGRNEPPGKVTVNGGEQEFIEVLKHDSWAATALYRGNQGFIVVKFNREQPLLFLPMRWLGRWLANREKRAWRLLRGIDGVPSDAGEIITEGRNRDTAAAHFYVAGHPLHIDEKPTDEFFSKLHGLIKAMHKRGLIYLDLNKRENILVTDDGRAVLVDYQLHFAPPAWTLRLPVIRWIFNQARAADIYHFYKHMRWHRPDLANASDAAFSNVQPVGVRFWRTIYVRPMQFMRRRLLIWLRIRDASGLAISELSPEKAARLSLERKSANPRARLPGEP